MPPVTFDNREKSGIILRYTAAAEEVCLPFVHSSAPDAYTIYMASDNQGNVEVAFSVTSLGWQSLQDAVYAVIEQYIDGVVAYGGAEDWNFDSYSIIFDPD